MVQFARHAVVEFNLEWAVKCYHCVACDHETTTEDKIIEHLKEHKIKQLSSVFVTSGASLEGDHISHSTSFNYSNDHETAIEQDDESEEPVKEETVSLADAITEGLSQEDAADIVANDHDMAVELNLTAPKTLGNKGTIPAGKRKAQTQRKRRTDVGTEKQDISSKQLHVEEAMQMGKDSKIENVLQGDIEVCRKKKEKADRRPPFECNVSKNGKYLCPVCNKEFTRRNTVRIHIEDQHTKNHSFLCSLCGRGFSYINTFKEHLLRHEDSRPFKCSKCRKGFTQAGKKRRHELICGFNGEPQYLCEYGCSKMFKTEEYLRTHIFNVHANDGFTCERCNKVFSHRSTLYKHRKKCIHDESLQTGNTSTFCYELTITDESDMKIEDSSKLNIHRDSVEYVQSGTYESTITNPAMEIEDSSKVNIDTGGCEHIQSPPDTGLQVQYDTVGNVQNTDSTNMVIQVLSHDLSFV